MLNFCLIVYNFTAINAIFATDGNAVLYTAKVVFKEFDFYLLCFYILLGVLMVTRIQAGKHNRYFGLTYCDLTDTYCLHRIKAVRLQSGIILYTYNESKAVLPFLIP